MLFIKKPIVVKAGQFFNSNPNWPTGVCISNEHFKGKPFVHTLSGEVKLEDGDWVVQLPSGECYPVKEHVFKDLYEEVVETVTPAQ